MRSGEIRIFIICQGGCPIVSVSVSVGVLLLVLVLVLGWVSYYFSIIYS